MHYEMQLRQLQQQAEATAAAAVKEQQEALMRIDALCNGRQLAYEYLEPLLLHNSKRSSIDSEDEAEERERGASCCAHMQLQERLARARRETEQLQQQLRQQHQGLQQLANESQACAAARLMRLEGKHTTLQPLPSARQAASEQLAAAGDEVPFSARVSTADGCIIPSPHS
ncbi:hypothetical protein Emag_004387 [Eimeria magna]